MALSGKLVRGFVAVVQVLAQKEEGKRGNSAIETLHFTCAQGDYEKLLAFVQGEDILPDLGCASKLDHLEERIFTENPLLLRSPECKSKAAVWAGECTPGQSKGKKKRIEAYIYPSDEAHFLPDPDPDPVSKTTVSES